jgi:2-dehydro-3-deoxygalactonokinase
VTAGRPHPAAVEDGFLAIDWGTTNLRAWRLGPGGEVRQQADFPLGVSRLAPGEAAARFENEVRPALGAQDLPAVLCGMVGSTLGWTIARYIPCPANLESLAAAMIEPAPGVRIVPGLTCAGLTGPDVMRGEETQILGWLAADPARMRGARLLCHPGTHAKWARVQDGAVTRFVTAMTGELYDVLGGRSVLRFADPQAEDPVAFGRGVAAAGDGGALAARLFGLRGLTVSGELAEESAASYLSGLLIGAEVAALWPMLRAGDHEAVDLLGDDRLCALYQRALAMRGVSSALADGDQAVRDGLVHIWKAAS